MSEWKEYKLGQVADISTGFAFKGDEYEFKGTLRVVRGENVTIGNLRWDSEKYWNKSTGNLEQYFLEENDIVIGMDGSRVGHNRAKIKYKELPLILAQRVARLRANNSFDQTFLWYHIYSDNFKDYVEAIHTGTSIPHISQKQIADFEILAPKLKIEQTAIASILSSLDDKIDLLQRQNTTLEKMAETLFRQWFVEEAKEEWEIGKVEHLFILQRGFDLPIQNRIIGNYPIIASSGESGFHNEFKVKAPGVTTGRSGVLGNVFFVQDDFWPLNTSLFIKEYRNSSPLHSYFVLKNIDLNGFNAGSAVPTLNRNHVHELSIEIPPMQLIHDFDKIAMPLFHKIKSNQTQIHTLTSLRDTLLPKLMSGEVRVKQ